MSAAKLADRIRVNRKSRSPVQDTVDKLYDEITDALAENSSLRAIHVQLTREGHNVGAHHTSLHAAYRIVKGRRERQSAPAQAVVTEGGRPAADSATDEPASTASGQTPTVVIDSRRKITEW